MHLVASGYERLVELRDLVISFCNCEVTFSMDLLNRGLQLSLRKEKLLVWLTVRE